MRRKRQDQKRAQKRAAKTKRRTSIVKSAKRLAADVEWSDEPELAADLSGLPARRSMESAMAQMFGGHDSSPVGLNRAERKRLTKELIRMQNKDASNAQIKGLIRSGQFPSRFAADQISAALFRQIRDAMSATLSFVGSATSGNVKALYVSVYQE